MRNDLENIEKKHYIISIIIIIIINIIIIIVVVVAQSHKILQYCVILYNLLAFGVYVVNSDVAVMFI